MAQETKNKLLQNLNFCIMNDTFKKVKKQSKEWGIYLQIRNIVTFI